MENFRKFKENILNTISEKIAKRLQSKKIEMAKEMFGEESMDEVLSPSDPIEDWIDDFIKSDAPQFKGKSKEDRIEMAKGAYYANKKK